MQHPTVTACFPAYNSEAFVRETLQSVLNQTYPNLRVLISDDASTDDTLTICKQIAASDPRVTVIGQPANLGWTRNCSALVEKVDSEFFFFAFHDDVLGPNYVERLVEALKENDEAVLAFCDADLVSPGGSQRRISLEGIDGEKDTLKRSLLIARRKKNWALAIHGMFRSEVVKPLGGPKPHLGGTVAADWPWVLSLALRGEFVRVPEVLFSKMRLSGSESRSWTRNRAMFAAVVLACAREVLKSPAAIGEKTRLLLALTGAWWKRIDSFSWKNTSWKHRRQAVRKITKLVPADETLILVDRDRWNLDGEVQCRVLPFLEKDGEYQGPPESDETAVAELNRMRNAGAGYFAIGWPAFWWFKNYAAFCDHLKSQHRCLVDDRSVVIFQLR